MYQLPCRVSDGVHACVDDVAAAILIYPAATAHPDTHLWEVVGILYHALGAVAFALFYWIYRTQGDKFMARLTDALEMVPSETKRALYKDTMVHTHTQLAGAVSTMSMLWV